MASKKAPLPFSARPLFAKDFLLLDGITRAGKFLLGNLVGTASGVEVCQYPFLMEDLLPMVRMGRIPLETCRIILQTDVDHYCFNRMIGRDLNIRVNDKSSIYNSLEVDQYLRRARDPDSDRLIARFKKDKRLLTLISHECLSNGRLLFRIFPRLRMINILRDPAALIDSWYRRGWGHRYGRDPKSISIAYKGRGGPIPWFAAGWKKGYHSHTEMDRIIESMVVINGMARHEYERLDKKTKKQILFVVYEDILSGPWPTMRRMSRFLGRRLHKSAERVVVLEKLPKKSAPEASAKVFEKVARMASPASRRVLEKLDREHRSFWLRLARG